MTYREYTAIPAVRSPTRPLAAAAAAAAAHHARERVPEVMRCPACHRMLEGAPAPGRFGAFVCACGHRIPFIAQVLVNVDGDRGELMGAIRAGDPDHAMRLLLQRHAPRTEFMRRLGMRLTFRRYVRHTLVATLVSPAADVLAATLRALEGRRAIRLARRLLGASVFNLYMRNRFTTPSFLAAVPLLGVLSNAPGLVLDAPCGYGHLSYAISRLVPEERIVAMDLRSSFAYAARRFFVPGAAAAVAHDMNEPLPLADGRFSAVFCSDAFQYIRDKRGLGREFMRLLRDDGVVVLAHLPNRLHFNLGAGHALAPDEYARVFDGFHVRMFTEQQMLETYLHDAPVDLTRSASRTELERAPVVMLVAAKSASALGQVPSPRRLLAERADNPRLNRLYRLRRREGSIVLRRRVPRALLVDFPSYPQLLPRKVVVRGDALRAKDARVRAAVREQLLREHVLVDLPVEY
jgi:SAM-dependent methyltransferase